MIAGSTVCLLALLFGSTEPAGASDAYRQALAGIEAEDWGGSTRLLRQVIQEDPRERAGIPGEPVYLPHYFLGLSVYRNGNCLLALEHWKESESQGAIQRSDFYRELLAGRGDCEKRFMEPAIVNMQVALGDVGKYVEMLDQQVGDAAFDSVWRRNPDWKSSARRSREEFEDIQKQFRLARESTDPSAIYELESRALELKREVKNLSSSVIDSAREQVATDRSETTEPRSSQESEVEPALASAAKTFFLGDYENTLRLLEAASPGEPWQQAQVELFRAASEFALYRLHGRSEQARLQAAESAIAAAIALDGDLEPDDEAFSPGFRSFFAETRGES